MEANQTRLPHREHAAMIGRAIVLSMRDGDHEAKRWALALYGSLYPDEKEIANEAERAELAAAPAMTAAQWRAWGAAHCNPDTLIYYQGADDLFLATARRVCPHVDQTRMFVGVIYACCHMDRRDLDATVDAIVADLGGE